jgi:hypothetical protein
MVLNDNQGQRLHDRVTRGHPLSAEEQILLQAWYATNDQEERTRLSTSREAEINALRQQLHSGLSNITATVERIQTLNRENESLDRELDALRVQLGRNVQKV